MFVFNLYPPSFSFATWQLFFLWTLLSCKAILKPLTWTKHWIGICFQTLFWMQTAGTSTAHWTVLSKTTASAGNSHLAFKTLPFVQRWLPWSGSILGVFCSLVLVTGSFSWLRFHFLLPATENLVQKAWWKTALIWIVGLCTFAPNCRLGTQLCISGLVSRFSRHMFLWW